MTLDEDKPPQLTVYEPNMLTTDIVYGFTLNPANQHPEDSFRFSTIYSATFHILKQCSFHYKLYPEFSSPPKSRDGKYQKYPRLHFHGQVTFKDTRQLLNFYETEYIKLSKFSAIEIQGDVNPTYYTKNKPIMKPICDYKKLPYVVCPENVTKALKDKTFSNRGLETALKIKKKFTDPEDDDLEDDIQD